MVKIFIINRFDIPKQNAISGCGGFIARQTFQQKSYFVGVTFDIVQSIYRRHSGQLRDIDVAKASHVHPLNRYFPANRREQ